MSRRRAVAAAGIGVGVDIGYLLTISGLGGDAVPRVVFLASFIAVMAAMPVGAAATAGRDEVMAQALLIASGTGLLEAGALALPSIGILLVLAGLLAFVSAGPRRVSWPMTVAISIVVTVVFLGGIALT
jgi:hypothetical protein